MERTGRRPAAKHGWQPKCQPWPSWGSGEPRELGDLAGHRLWEQHPKPHFAQLRLESSCGQVRAPCLLGGGVPGAEGSHPGRAGNREAKAFFVQTDSGLQVSTRGSRQWVGPLGQSQRGSRTPGTPGRGAFDYARVSNGAPRT